MTQPMKHATPTVRKFATLTALAAACTMMLSAPAIAAPSTAATNASVPSAIDSSKRVIRLASSGATLSQAQPTAPSTVPVAEATATAQAAPPILRPVGVDTDNAPARVYQSAPISSSGMDISRGQLANIPVPQVRVTDISFVPTVLIPQKQGLGTDKLDVSLLDDFIKEASPNARHYPPNFPNRSQRHYTREKVKAMAEWIEPYASAPNASYDVLLRATKLNGMGRNLDLGSDFAVRGGQYADRAIKVKPDSGEANFLYGMMLSEGGGFKEGQKYLDRAVSLGYTEAEQSLAQSDLLSDRRSQALDRLRRLEQQVPDNRVIRQQIKLIEEGKFYIWDIPAPSINIKPTS